MVRPVSPAERSRFARKVQVVVTLLVGASAGLVALQADATLAQAGMAAVISLPLGAAVAWFVVPTGTAPADRSSRGSEQNHSYPRADGSGSAGDDQPDEHENRDANGRTRR